MYHFAQNCCDDRSITMQDALSEIDTLQAIFNDELVVDKSNMYSESSHITVQRLVRPAEQSASGSQATSLKSAVSVLVFIRIDAEYPTSSPVVEIRQPRGLVEDDVRCLEAQIASHLHANVGAPIIFEIFQLAQDFLESCDVPRTLCSICLAEFSSEAAVASTECGHFFHRRCLGRYLRHCEEEMNTLRAETPSHLHYTLSTTPMCPVCRAELSGFSRNELVPADGSEDKSPDCCPQTAIDFEPWRTKQLQLNEILERQRANGGLIDLNVESKRNLITEDTRVVIPIAAVEEAGPSMSSTSASTEREEEPTQNAKQRRHRRGGRNTHYMNKMKGIEETHNFVGPNSSSRRPPKAPHNEDGRINDNS